MLADLALVFSIGFLGSAHCAGMCGGFAMAVARGRGVRRWVHQGAYLAGKTATYVFLGALLAGMGGAVLQPLSPLQDVLSILVGLLLIGIGISLLGFRFTGLPGLGRLPLHRPLAFFLRQPSFAGSMGLGAVNGLLPCGLVYAMLARATASGSVWAGGLTMGVFGLATAPALLVTGLLGSRLSPAIRFRMNRLSGVLVIVLGLITLLRGTPLMAWFMHMVGGAHPMPGG